MCSAFMSAFCLIAYNLGSMHVSLQKDLHVGRDVWAPFTSRIYGGFCIYLHQ